MRRFLIGALFGVGLIGLSACGGGGGSHTAGSGGGSFSSGVTNSGTVGSFDTLSTLHGSTGAGFIITNASASGGSAQKHK